MCASFSTVSASSPYKKIKLETQDPPFLELDSDEEEFGFVLSSHSPVMSSRGDNVNIKVGAAVVENGELEGNDKEYEILDPPPIPLRSHSLSPGLNISHDKVKDDTGTDMDSTDPWVRENSGDSDSFLLEGRGGERDYPPLPKMTNGTAVDDDEESPPPVPIKQGSKSRDITAEKMALIDELEILEKMVESTPKKMRSSGENSEIATSDKESEEHEEISSRGYAFFLCFDDGRYLSFLCRVT